MESNLVHPLTQLNLLTFMSSELPPSLLMGSVGMLDKLQKNWQELASLVIRVYLLNLTLLHSKAECLSY